jgi:hypothetical protein
MHGPLSLIFIPVFVILFFFSVSFVHYDPCCGSSCIHYIDNNTGRLLQLSVVSVSAYKPYYLLITISPWPMNPIFSSPSKMHFVNWCDNTFTRSVMMYHHHYHPITARMSRRDCRRATTRSRTTIYDHHYYCSIIRRATNRHGYYYYCYQGSA